MKSLILALALLVPFSASAEEFQVPKEPFIVEIPHVCGPAEDVLNALKQVGEDLKFVAEAKPTEEGDRLYVTLWLNNKNKSWTVVLTNKDKGVSCMLSEGTGFAELWETGILTGYDGPLFSL